MFRSLCTSPRPVHLCTSHCLPPCQNAQTQVSKLIGWCNIMVFLLWLWPSSELNSVILCFPFGPNSGTLERPCWWRWCSPPWHHPWRYRQSLLTMPGTWCEKIWKSLAPQKYEYSPIVCNPRYSHPMASSKYREMAGLQFEPIFETWPEAILAKTVSICAFVQTLYNLRSWLFVQIWTYLWDLPKGNIGQNCEFLFVSFFLLGFCLFSWNKLSSLSFHIRWWASQ